MNQQTIKKLNQLNKKFYQAIANDFSDTRQYFWQGWNKLIPHIKNLIAKKAPSKKISVLDIGCGNGRFALFLHKYFANQFEYLGVDNDKQLLDIAQKQLANQTNIQILQVDLVKQLLTNTLFKQSGKLFDVIVAFGLIHHIPSFALRKKLVKNLEKLLKKDGLLVVSFWQFANDTRFKNRVVEPNLVNIDQKNLEKNDFILDWRKGQTAHRYCHFVNQEEAEKLLAGTNLKIEQNFYADGKSGKLNWYLVLKKI